ncbi:hypothetical protein Tco_0617393 [Tanacetum coccineum]
MERFENAIFKQQEEINDRMTKMFRLLNELTSSRTPEIIDVATSNVIEKPTGTETGMQVKEAEKKNEAGKEEMIEEPSSQPVEYYLKHSINKKLIERLVDNRRFNDSLSGA